jgi:hypothetical protein
MARLLPALVGSVFLASVTFGVGAAQSEVCVADDQTICPSAVVDPTQDLSPPTDALLPDAQPVPAVTRTIDPPSVVQPFSGVAAPAAQPEEQMPALTQRPNPQKLPPGPPSRYP